MTINKFLVHRQTPIALYITASTKPSMLTDAEMQSEEEEVEMTEQDYERERQENIRENAALLSSLGLDVMGSTRRGPGGRKVQVSSEEQRLRRESRAKAAALKRPLEPIRRSGRVAAKAVADVSGHVGSNSPPASKSTIPKIPKQVPPKIPSGPEYDLSGPLPSQPIPTRDENGVLLFEKPWLGIFEPNLTPEEMFRGGAFGGAYFWVLNQTLSASFDVSSLPFTLPADLVATHLSRSIPEGSVNRFGVRAGQSLQEWEKSGWIHSEDPRGWAQWYTRFWAGRRSADDKRQITRWAKIAGPTGRFKNNLIKHVLRAGGRDSINDEEAGRIVRQTLWQWGYQLTESDWDKMMRDK